MKPLHVDTFIIHNMTIKAIIVPYFTMCAVFEPLFEKGEYAIGLADVFNP